MRLKLIEARKKANISQSQAAKLFNLAPSTYCEIEHNKSNPSLKKAIEIASILGTTVEELFVENLGGTNY